MPSTKSSLFIFLFLSLIVASFSRNCWKGYEETSGKKTKRDVINAQCHSEFCYTKTDRKSKSERTEFDCGDDYCQFTGCQEDYCCCDDDFCNFDPIPPTTPTPKPDRHPTTLRTHPIPVFTDPPLITTPQPEPLSSTTNPKPSLHTTTSQTGQSLVTTTHSSAVVTEYLILSVVLLSSLIF